MKTNVQWQENLHFKAVNDRGHEINMDTRLAEGQTSQGPTPVEILLSSIGGCTGMDVVSILKKMRQNITALNIEITGARNDENIRKLTDIHVHYQLEGEIKPERAARAIQLSMEEYCMVSNTIGAKISYSYEINGQS